MVLRKGRTLGAIAIAIIGVLATASGAGAGVLSSFTVEQATQVDAAIQGVMSTENVPGVNVGVYEPGKRYENSYGVSDTVTNAPMSPDDTVRIASISKTFTAVAVLRLIDRKKLRLTDTLNKYVKGVPNGKRINIRKLLAMTAGIYNFSGDDRFNAAFSADPLYPGWKPADLLPILERHDPDFPPGGHGLLLRLQLHPARDGHREGDRQTGQQGDRPAGEGRGPGPDPVSDHRRS